ncbi:MAG: sigma-70 family RNA polymerase sigma factor [Myxococcales bacterium]|nr:sigma-70 family RNA polymerase sigma factor [Myxococcales bacterium]
MNKASGGGGPAAATGPSAEAPEVQGEAEDEALDGEVLSLGDDAGLSAEAVAPDEAALAKLEPEGRADGLQRFLSQIRKYPLLQEDEERALGREVREGQDPDAARRLVVHNLRLVVTIAYEFRRAWANVLDLIQEGSVGLTEAVNRWDPDRGARFGTYAGYWIRAYVLRFILTNFRLVHVGNTRAGRRLFFQLERERQRLIGLGVEPTTARLAEQIGVEEREIHDVARTLDGPELSFDAPVGEGRRSLADSVGDADEDPESAAAGAELSETLMKLTHGFAEALSDPRERALWQEHLLSDDPVSLSELGERFGVSKQRMGQLVIELKKRFRDKLTETYGPDLKLSWLLADAPGA